MLLAIVLAIGTVVLGRLVLGPAAALSGAPQCASAAQLVGGCTSTLRTAVLFTDANHTTNQGNTTTVTVRPVAGAPGLPDSASFTGTLGIATGNPVTLEI